MESQANTAKVVCCVAIFFFLIDAETKSHLLHTLFTVIKLIKKNTFFYKGIFINNVIFYN